MARTRGYRPWTTTEIAVMRDNARAGVAAVAKILGRSQVSVRCAAARHRVSLRRAGSRKGRVLGQVAGQALDAQTREALLDAKRAELIAARMLDPEDALCPTCAKRPARIRSTGLCRVCHLKRLSENHREVLQEEEAGRELMASRAALARSRRRRHVRAS